MNNIEQLTQSNLWRKVQETFAEQYSVPFLVVDRDANVLFSAGKLPFLHTLIEHKAPGKEQEKLRQTLAGIGSEGVIHESLSGLIDLVRPIYLNHVLQGAIVIPGLRDGRDLMLHFSRIAPALQLEKDELIDAYHQVPIHSFHIIQSFKKILEVLVVLFPKLAKADASAVQQISHLTHLKKIAELFDASLNLESMLDMITKTLAEQYNISNCTVILFDKLRKHYYADDQALPYEGIEEVIIQRLKKHRQMCIIHNLKNDFMFTHMLFGEKNASIIAIPMNKEEVLQRILIIYGKPERNWNDEELNALQEIATRANKALEKASAFSSVQTEAKTDRLTGLYNKGFFLDQLQLNLQLHKEKNQATSLIIFDLDNFKQLNDTYGHQKGDEVLHHVAQLLKENIRKQDFAARFGGEEFVVILPNTKHDEARFVAERVREAIAMNPYASLSLTVSAGLACVLNSSSLPSELIREADQCLYDAKSAGKNCIKSSIIVDRSLGSVQVDKVNNAYVGK